jgi:hypothetical protein
VENKLITVHTEKRLTCKANIFIDTAYEGDLTAMAGVSYSIGRENNNMYDELHKGIQYSTHHNLKMFVDPFDWHRFLQNGFS